MTTTLNRWETVQAIVTALRASSALTGVQITTGFPGDRNVTAEAIWIDLIDGQLEIPVMTGGRKEYDDTFDIPIEVRIAGQIDGDYVRGRLEDVAGTVLTILQNDTQLSNLDGIVSATVTRIRSDVNGTPDGYIGFAEVTVEVHSRIL